MPNRTAQEAQQPENDPRQEQVRLLSQQIAQNQTNPISLTNQIITTLDLLMSDTDYGPDNQSILSVMKNKYKDLLFSLEGGIIATAFVKSAQQIQQPATPSPDYKNATSLYQRLQMLQNTLSGLLKRQQRYMNQGSNLIDQANNANQDWAVSYAPSSENWKNSQIYGWELDLLDKRASTVDESSSKVAYPVIHMPKLSRGPDLDKWKKTAIKMDAFKRVYGQNYTFSQILYHFTKDWNMFERFDFKKWYKWNYRKASNNKMKKSADTVAGDRLQQFTNKRKKLMSRINLIRKALHDLINAGLIDPASSGKLYKIISMLEYESMGLQAPKLAAARLRRAAKQFSKLGFTEGEKVLKTAATELLNTSNPIIRTAEINQQEAVGLLRKIKNEMDNLSYSRHLDTLFNIKKDLEKMGRTGDAEAIEKVIRDDLSTLEKLNKKLTEVYTNLSKVPLELSEKEDHFNNNPAQEKVIETPIEVSEEEIPQQKEKVQPRTPIQKRIPNV